MICFLSTTYAAEDYSITPQSIAQDVVHQAIIQDRTNLDDIPTVQAREIDTTEENNRGEAKIINTIAQKKIVSSNSLFNDDNSSPYNSKEEENTQENQDQLPQWQLQEDQNSTDNQNMYLLPLLAILPLALIFFIWYKMRGDNQQSKDLWKNPWQPVTKNNSALLNHVGGTNNTQKNELRTNRKNGKDISLRDIDKQLH